MRKTKAEILSELLEVHDVPSAARVAILNGVYGVASQRVLHAKSSPIDATWQSLLYSLRAVRANVQSNRSNWAPSMTPLYEEYITILSAIRERIEKARTTALKDDMGTLVPSLSQWTGIMAHKNKIRADDGRPSLGDCNTHWQSWVPPHVRREFWDKVRLEYARMGRMQGNVFTPFLPRNIKTQTASRRHSLGVSIEGVFRACSAEAPEGAAVSNLRANTPYKALYMTAARMAQREAGRLATLHTNDPMQMVDSPYPINWKHLLTPQMRARLREADANPKAVSTDGLDSFYRPEARDRLIVQDDEVLASMYGAVQVEADDDYEDSEPCS